MSFKKKGTLFLAVIFAASTLAGCGEGGSLRKTPVIDEVTTSDTYPIDTDVTLTYWTSFASNLSDSVKSLNDTPYAQEWQKQTGINVEFKHPVAGQTQESFNLMVAGGDYPDIIANYWTTYSGGPGKAVEDGVIYPLNDVIEKVSPNLKALLESDQDLRRQISANGDIYLYPFYRGDEILCTCYGVMARSDLLEELGMEAPETMDEWEAMLRGFKDKVEVPFAADLTPSVQRLIGDLFVGAYGIGSDFYLDGDTVKYGPLEPEFKDYVAKMASWYADGLIDKDFATNDTTRIGSLVINGQMGAVEGYNGSSFGTWLAPMREKNPGADMVALKYPVLNKGDRPQFGQKEVRAAGYGSAISTQCKNVEVAARFLDYGYSKAGEMLHNFGLEGVSYEMKDNVPTYTKLITNAESEGTSMAQQLAMYTGVGASGPFVQSKDYIMQYYRDDVQKDALAVWSDTDALDHILPNLSYSAEDSSRLSKLMNDIRTNVDETVLKMIMGSKSVLEYDSFVETLKSMGIEEAIEINQKAYDAYMAQ